MTKAESQFKHAKRRAYERYGIFVDKPFIRNIVRLIQNGNATLITKQSRRVTIWDVVLEGNTYRVIYDNRTKNIATFLPINSVGENSLGEGDLDGLSSY
jgi:predicted NUDIX family NTP pyrophosphohydrolase